MSQLITLFERQSISYQAIDLNINDSLLETLERINQSAGVELIKLERNKLSATQYVGVIQADEYTIQVLPKIDCDPGINSDPLFGSKSYERAAVSAAQNFLHLLAHARDLKLHEQSLSSLSTSKGSWVEMLIRLFSEELLIQLEQGFHQDYVRKDDLLPYLRGRWNIARQFIQNPNMTQGLDVSFDDYLPDTLLNRVFRLAANRLSLVSRDRKNRQLLADIENWLQPVQLQLTISSSDLDQVIINRLNERFASAFQLARLLLEGQTIQSLAGGQRAYAFVFNMDLLFEKFIANIFQTHKRKIFPGLWQELTIELQGKLSNKHLVVAPFPSEKGMFHLEPDIFLTLSGLPFLIIDTKNKALPLQQSHRAVAEGDVYQMLVYATQFRCPNVLLLYPRTLGASDILPICLSINQTQIRLFVATINLHQSLYQLDPLIMELQQIIESIQVQETILRR